jgi:hypothetical protein
VDSQQVIETLRTLLLIGFGLSALLAFVVFRADSEAGWRRRYLDEHPGVRQDFLIWRRHRRRELLLAAGRCPDHDDVLDARGECARCRGVPSR